MHVRTAVLPEDRPLITDLLGRIAAAEGFPALSEEAAVHLPTTTGPCGWVAEADGEAVAFAHLRGHRGMAVVEIAALRENAVPSVELLLPSISSQGGARIWASDPAVAAALSKSGATVTRSLVRLERKLSAGEVAAPEVGARIVPFRAGADEGAYLIVANDAFRDHPESGAWTRDTFDERSSRPWFDPNGLFIAWDRGRPVGVCWTKVHAGGPGEIYSIAVRPSASGRGIGRALIMRGFDYLATVRGVDTGMLWADQSNEAAVRMYTRLGMSVVRERTEFALEA